MKLYRIKYTQDLPISLDECWDFFSDPTNLAKITPSKLGFQIKTDLPEKIYEGLIIEYTVKPLF